MSTQNDPTTPLTSPAGADHDPTRAKGRSGSAGQQVANRQSPTSVLVTEHGKTTISTTVVEKIAGMATREVPGVYKLGTSVTRAFGSMRERIPGQKTSVGQGVAVEVGERQAAIDLDVVVEYGALIVEVADAVRSNVIGSLESMTGLEVTEVNIAIDNIHLPEDDDDDDGESRVE